MWKPISMAKANTRKNDGSVLYEMELYDDEQSMSEQNKEVPDVNESK